MATKTKPQQLARPHKQLRLVASKPNVDITVDMGDGAATPSAGYAGWEEVPRVKRRAMTAFKGLPAFQQDVPIFIDGFAEDRSIERQVEAVLSLGAAVVFTALGPIWNSGGRFVFGDEPEFTEQIRASDETLVRVRLVLKLMEYVAPNVAGEKAKPKVSLGNAVPLEFTVHDGADTLVKIAFRIYHDKTRWKEIGQKNGISDPYRKLPMGRKLAL